MKKKVYVGLFSALLLVGGTSVYTFAEETTDEVKTEEVAKEQVDDVKPNLGKVTLIGEAFNDYEHLGGDYEFSVAKPAEFQGLKLGELKTIYYQYDPSDPNLIGFIRLYHTVFDNQYDSELYYRIYDEGNNLVFRPTKGNMNVGQEKYPGKVGPTPYLGGETNNGAPFFETPNGTYSAFVRVIFTNVPQPSEDDENNDTNNAVVEQPENSTNNSQNQTDTTESKNTTDSKTNAVKQNEKEFVNNVKKTGDTSEKYADNKKLPQTSQSNTVLPGLMLLLLGSVTAVFAKFKFSTK